MTSWSGGVRTGGWRVKNRSKFSAFRPHYERGRKELVVGGNKTKPNAKIKQNWTEPGVVFPPIPSLWETQRGCFNDQEWEQCQMQNPHDLWNMTLGSYPLSAVALRSVLVSSWEVRKCMAKAWDGGTSSMWHVPTRVTHPQWLILTDFNNDPFIHHLASTSFIAADPFKCSRSGTIGVNSSSKYSFQTPASGGRSQPKDLSGTTKSLWVNHWPLMTRSQEVKANTFSK